MWLLVYVPAVFGILRHRHWPYWRWVVAMLAWQSAAQFLFSGGGSKEHPERYGLIMRAMVEATNDGPEIGLFAIVFLPVFWGGMIYFARKLYLESKAPDLGGTSVKPVSGLRKGFEIAALTAAAGAVIYVNFATLKAPGASPPLKTPSAVSAPIDVDIDRMVDAINAAAPLEIDDITVLTRASRQARVLIYDYRVSDARITREALAAYLRDGKVRENCRTPENRRLLDEGATLRFRYALATGEAPVSKDFTADDCPAK